MTKSIIVHKTPMEILPFDEIIFKMQEYFAHQGVFKGLIQATIEREAKRVLELNREVFLSIIRDNTDLFGETDLEDIDIEKTLDQILEKYLPEIETHLEQYLLAQTDAICDTRVASFILGRRELAAIADFPCDGKAHNFPNAWCEYTKLETYLKDHRSGDVFSTQKNNILRTVFYGMKHNPAQAAFCCEKPLLRKLQVYVSICRRCTQAALCQQTAAYATCQCCGKKHPCRKFGRLP